MDDNIKITASLPVYSFMKIKSASYLALINLALMTNQ